MTVLAIDPGPKRSAYVVWSGVQIVRAEIADNDSLISKRSALRFLDATCAIEMIASYGMAVGKEVFETCCWIGRFHQVWWDWSGCSDPLLIMRREIKLHHCGSSRATDANVRQALIDKYGAPGTKKEPGATYGLKKDLWSAFAIATYVTETRQPKIETRGLLRGDYTNA